MCNRKDSSRNQPHCENRGVTTMIYIYQYVVDGGGVQNYQSLTLKVIFYNYCVNETPCGLMHYTEIQDISSFTFLAPALPLAE